MDFRDNKGFVTENSGTSSSISTGATITHDLSRTPTSVSITRADSGVTDYYVDALNSSTFRVNFSGGGGHVFYWKAEAPH